MAEVILSPVADLIIETLGSAAVKKIGELYSVRDDLEELKGTLSTIRAVLRDAERQQTHNNQVRLWLERLEDVVSDADDLVDEVATEGLRRQSMPDRNRVFKTLRIFFSSSNQLVVRSKLAGEIGRVRKRLATIAADRRDFKLEESREEIARPVRIRRETHSFVAEESVVGRVEDKKRVLELVLDDNEVEERVCVVPIFGMGGLGKTTLAQLIFNHEEVKKRFDARSWVCVSDNFDEKVIVGLIVRSLAGTSTRVDDSTMEELIKTMREKMNGKRYLLVLDDVWNENHQKWQDLMSILTRCGDSGSRIIITTRSERVAKLASNVVRPCRLGILNDEESWSLFKKIAFEQREEPREYSDMGETGKEIVKKCGGVPLAIRMIASMLSMRDPKTEWGSFLKKELSSLPQQENDILPTLKLSYDSLPSHLKHCFASCSLFPKDHKIYVKELINLWEGLGFIDASPEESQSLEQMGYDHFMELFFRCFFQEAVRDEHNKVITCKMHDLVHDLAIQVAGNKYALLERGSKEYALEKVCHVSFGDLSGGLPTSLLQAKRLRTIFRPIYRYIAFDRLDPEVVASNFSFLRMLDLHSSCIEKVPNSIGKLRHLRYLDLSDNFFESLPDSITKLFNLHTLKLNECASIRELPRDTKKLVNLRRLEFTCWLNFELYLPKGVSQLTNLQTLSCFPLSEDVVIASRCSKLDELMGLSKLRGKLEIRGLKSGMETSGANLKDKKDLHILLLKWSRNSSSDQQPEKTLTGLQPQPNLKELSVEGYDGVRFSNWLSSLTNLVELRLENCLNLQHLPSLDLLRFLKKMSLDNCPALESIITTVNGDGSLAKKAVSVLPSLQRLELKSLSNFRGWQTLNSSTNAHHLSYFPSLTYLLIHNCAELRSMPLYPSVRHLELKCTNKKPFVQTAYMDGDYTKSQLSKNTSLYPLSAAKTLHLSFSSGSDVKHFPSWMQSLSSLDTIEISEHKGIQVECQVMEYSSSKLKWMIEEREDRELVMEDNRASWGSFSRISRLVLEGAPISKYIPVAAQFLNSLEELVIKGHEEVELSLDNIDMIKWEALTSLHTVVFDELPKLVAIPKWLQYLTTLQVLEIRHCDSLTTIPDSVCKLPLLQDIEIWGCPEIGSFPESMSCLVSRIQDQRNRGRKFRTSGCIKTS